MFWGLLLSFAGVCCIFGGTFVGCQLRLRMVVVACCRVLLIVLFSGFFVGVMYMSGLCSFSLLFVLGI